MFNEMMRAEIWLHDTLDTHSRIEALAGRLGYSTSQVRRRFRECFGMSPSAYRDRLRLEKAARLLVHTPERVRRIAERCGYTNHSAFSRAFQRQYHCTPRQFRRRQGATPGQAGRDEPVARFGVRIRRIRPQAAVVTRLYRPSHALRDPTEWRDTEGAAVLARQLDGVTSIALLHDQPMGSELPRTDLGATVVGVAAEELALPPAFRHLTLPARRCACLTLPAIDQLPEAIDFLVGEALPSLGEHLNGEALRLLRKGAGLELQMPLLEPG